MTANRRTRRSDTRTRVPRARGRGSRRRVAALLIVGLVAAALVGCATKRDLQQLRDEVITMQARQDSLFQAMERRNAALIDTLRNQSELVLRVRGDLGRQLVTMEQQLIQIQELSGQSQRRLTELREELDTRARMADVPVDEIGMDRSDEAGPAAPTAPPAGTAEELYGIGMEQLRRGAAGTARRAFQQLLEQHQTHELAPDAQYNMAETYVLEGDLVIAYREFDRVVERYPETPRAPAALYRAAILADEAGDYGRAREYLQRVSSGYPRSDEARLARERLPEIPR